MEKLLFNDFPNTYTLTKHFAEKLVYHQAYFLPTGIFRPPLVRKRGWLENLFLTSFFSFEGIVKLQRLPGFHRQHQWAHWNRRVDLPWVLARDLR